MLKIVAGGLDDPRVIRLLGIHLTNSRAQTAPGSAHALDLAGLKSPEICFWCAWDGDDLLATGAMKRLSHSHGEVKSMHTAESVRRRGVGSAMLEHIIQRRASAITAACRASKTERTLRGKTRLCTTAAQTVPSTVSSVRAIAMSKTPSGLRTLGKPIRAAV
jgi:GNAT superfamily N-acetyltransferase